MSATFLKTNDKSKFIFSLTFDDGPGPSTEALLDVLKKFRVKATFFILGKNLAEAPWCEGNTKRAMNIVVRAIQEGHSIGNHAYSHATPGKISSKAFTEEIRRCDQLIRKARRIAGVNVDAPIPLRLPYGIMVADFDKGFSKTGNSDRFLDPRVYALASTGRGHIHWTAILEDWALSEIKQGPILYKRMLAHSKEMKKMGLCALYVLHDSGEGSPFERQATVEGVRLFLAHSKKNGWKTFTLSKI